MNEAMQLSAANRDWRVRCYDATGAMRVCVIDSDHGALRIALIIGEQEQFFELQAGQVDQFRDGLEATLSVIKINGPDEPVRWVGHCYSRWGGLLCCLIEAAQHEVVRISCVAARIGRRGEWSFELRENQIGEFQAALTAAMKVCHTDIATHREHWADDEVDETEAPRGMEETPFAREINKMVAAEAPETIAVVAEIGDRVDAMITAWCFSFPDHAEVISAGPDGVRGSFSTPQRALKLLSAGGEATLRLVPVTEAQEQAKAA
jgi:hypothetical protein